MRIDSRRFVALIAVAFSVVVISLQAAARSDTPAAVPTSQPVDLALNKAASASATESDEHAAEKANDGDDDSRWCADSESVPQWWQVDLGKPATVAGCQIKFEFDEKQYQYVVEGSADASKWTTLSDQSASTEKKQVQKLTFAAPAEGVRYVRIRFTTLDDGCWASMFDVKVFGK